MCVYDMYPTDARSGVTDDVVRFPVALLHLLMRGWQQTCAHGQNAVRLPILLLPCVLIRRSVYV